MAVIALAQKKTQIVKTSLVGASWSNLLLVMGMCFFSEDCRRRIEYFNTSSRRRLLLPARLGRCLRDRPYCVRSDQLRNPGRRDHAAPRGICSSFCRSCGRSVLPTAYAPGWSSTRRARRFRCDPRRARRRRSPWPRLAVNFTGLFGAHGLSKNDNRSSGRLLRRLLSTTRRTTARNRSSFLRPLLLCHLDHYQGCSCAEPRSTA